MSAYIECKIENNVVTFIDHGGYESRNESMISLFTEAFNILDKKIENKTFYINTDDIGININNSLTFGFTKTDGVISCPDFSFDKWIECGIEDYTNTTNKIKNYGLFNKPLYNKLFWIGNPLTQPLRNKLLEIGKNNNHIMDIRSMDWIRNKPFGIKHEYTNYVSLEEHTNFKYLIDCGAGGYSARLKFLLFTNRPLFLVDRDISKQEYFYGLLKPYIHYIPVDSNLNDLLDKLKWAEQNEEQTKIITKNALSFADKYLTKENIIITIKELLNKHL